MQYITSEADREVILRDNFVQDNWVHIEQLAASEEDVVLWSVDDEGNLDKSTWQGYDYEPFVEAIWREMCIHSNHQQRIENYVQLTGLLSKTGVGEVRRSCRAIMIGCIIRRFNPWALEKKNKMLAREGKKPISRLHSSDKVTLFLKYIAKYFIRSDRARSRLSDCQYTEICERLGSDTMKSSKVER